MSDPLADPRAIDLLAAEPDEAGALAGVFRTAASESSRTAVGLAAAQHDGTWAGRAADAFRTAIGGLPGRLGRLGTGFFTVAQALAWYESTLADIQPVFVSVIAELENARYRLPALQDGAALACQTEISHLRRRAYELLDEFAAAREDCRDAIEAAQHGAPVAPPVGSGETVIDVGAAFPGGIC
jgi:hypothetical protein